MQERLSSVFSRLSSGTLGYAAPGSHRFTPPSCRTRTMGGADRGSPSGELFSIPRADVPFMGSRSTMSSNSTSWRCSSFGGDMGTKLQLRKEWTLGEAIGSGGFGRVYLASAPGEKPAVAKLVPKDPGAQRELLFVDLAGVRNVVPVLDSGETSESWVIVMPRATMSLREHIRKVGGQFEVIAALKILSQIATALVDLAARSVVHRDLKPENVLLLDQSWCLADFGISRYAEATTAPDTRKYAWSPLYAAPERWRHQRATAATDIYSWGVIAYELLSGSFPFNESNVDNLREQHLHGQSTAIANVPVALDALVTECLYKAPEARPTPGNVLTRIERLQASSSGTGLAKLREAHLADAVRRGELQRQESQHQTEEVRRSTLAADAEVAIDRIAKTLRESMIEAAPSAVLNNQRGGGWTIRLYQSELQFSPPVSVTENPWGSTWSHPKFDVIASARLSIQIPANSYEYEGRSHSLWFCDAREMGNYQWFETAFMISPLIPGRGRQNPFALDPSEESRMALAPGLTEFQVAWPFTPIVLGQMEEFINRWAAWLADASQGKLAHPNSMPERLAEGSWRRQ